MRFAEKNQILIENINFCIVVYLCFDSRLRPDFKEIHLLIFIEIKPIDVVTKPIPSADLVQEIATPTTKMPAMPTAIPKPSPGISKRDTLLRLKRQLALENELSSAADESENLGIEQVNEFFLIQMNDNREPIFF